MTSGGAPSTVDPEVARLVSRAVDGDSHAFAQLYEQYVDLVYGYVIRRVRSRTTAEDLTSDVFLRAWNGISRFRWQGVDVGAWLMTIARNRVYDHFKSARFQREHSTDNIRDSANPSTLDDPGTAAEHAELQDHVQDALEELRPAHREVIELRFLHERTVEETANILDRTIGATKALQYRALKALARVLEE